MEIRQQTAAKTVRLSHWENDNLKSRAEFDPKTDLLDGHYIEYHTNGHRKTAGVYAQNYRIGIHADYDVSGRVKTVLEYAHTLEDVLQDPLPRRKIYHNGDGTILELVRTVEGTFDAKHHPKLD